MNSNSDMLTGKKYSINIYLKLIEICFNRSAPLINGLHL